MTLIVRTYATDAKANKAVAELKAYGFTDQEIVKVSPPSGSDANGLETVGAAIKQIGVSDAKATTYADSVKGGHTLVAVRPPFGFSHTAIEILDSHKPEAALDGEEHHAAAVAADWSDATPFSRSLGLKVLSSDPTPFSTFFKQTVLKDDPAPFSKAINMNELSSKQFVAGTPILNENPTPLSTAMGAKVLSDEPAPFSKKFGWKTLLNDPTPFSNWFKWKVLSDKQ
jgi:hypothetical protein